MLFAACVTFSQDGKPKSIEPEWVKLFSDLYWAAQADLRKPLPESIEEVLVPVEDSEEEESGEESGGEGPEEDGGEGAAKDGDKPKEAPKEGEPGWDVEKLRFTEARLQRSLPHDSLPFPFVNTHVWLTIASLQTF